MLKGDRNFASRELYQIFHGVFHHLPARIIDPSLKISDFFVEIVNDEWQSILRRFLKRYLNMRSKEFLSQVKTQLKNKKDAALREALTKKRTKGSTKSFVTQMMHSLFDDTTEAKMASHLKMKAQSLSGGEALTCFTKIQLHFFHLIYGEKFSKSKKKKETSMQFCQKLQLKEGIAHPALAKRSAYDIVEKYHIEGKKLSIATLYQELGLQLVSPDELNESENTAQEATIHLPQDHNVTTGSAERVTLQPQMAGKKRLPKFKPSDMQKKTLQEDNENHAGKVPMNVTRSRAQEFAVEVTQIQRWHRLYNKRKNDAS